MLVPLKSLWKVPSPGPATAPYSTGVHTSWRGGVSQGVKNPLKDGGFRKAGENLPELFDVL